MVSPNMPEHIDVDRLNLTCSGRAVGASLGISSFQVSWKDFSFTYAPHELRQLGMSGRPAKI